MRMRKLLLICALPLLLGACATIDMDCATSGTQTFTIGGSNVGNQLLTAGMAAAKTAGFLAMAKDTSGNPVANPACHVHYTYVPIFGTDTVASQHLEPTPTTPTPVNVTVQLAPGTSVTPSAPLTR